MSEPVKLEGLHLLEYEHPFDAKALNADLEKTPGLNTVIRQVNKQAVERYLRVVNTGSHLRITEHTYPQIYAVLDEVCTTINLPERPDFYLEWEYAVNGYTIGVERPLIMLKSGAIDLMDKAERRFVVGHEVGHIKSRHVLYSQTAMVFPIMAEIVGTATFGVGEMLSWPLQLALLGWQRMSEFTADRAGLLACQDFSAVTRAMMKLAGMPTKHYNDMVVESFLQQARDFEQLDYDVLNKAVKFLSILSRDHPWTVMRVAELLRWVESGEYGKVLRRETRDRIGMTKDGEGNHCRACGYKVEEDSGFCSWCGANLKGEKLDSAMEGT